MLGVNSLVVSNGPTALLGPISFDVSAGSALVIMGETGAGKSLIAQAIMGTIPVPLNVRGEISFDSRRIDQFSKSDRELLWGKHIASLPQEPWRALSPLARSYQQIYESHRFVAGLDSNAAARRTEADFESLNLLGAQTKRPGELSGGMGQRVAIAAALAAKARLLLADEPTKGLDEDRKEAVINILKSVLHRKDSLVVITHDVSVAKSVGGKILVLKDGELVEQGHTVDVLTRPVHAYTQELIDADPSCWDNTSVTHQGPSILKLRKLVAGRGGKALTKPLDLNITQGRRIAVTGPSGTGKSTLLDTIAEIIKPLSGALDRSSTLKPTDIQKIYQDPPAAFARSVSLRNSLNDVAKLHEVAWSIVEQYLHLLGISTDLLNRLPTAVSGGELQRIAIARALIVKPKLILADEPTSRLDPITQKQTMNMLADVANVHNTAVLLVTHDRTLAKNWTDETIFLD